MKTNLLIILLLFISFPLCVKGATTVYSNNFDTLNGIYTNNGSGGGVSIESGQLKLTGTYSYRGPFITLPTYSFGAPYAVRLVDVPGKISWSFNVSNMDSQGLNNSFKINLVCNKVCPYDSDQFSYRFMGGGMVGDRMQLLRSTSSESPYGNNYAVLVDVPSSNGLSPLPEKGSFRIEFTPSTGLWNLYGQYGNSYTDPTRVTNLLGSAHDNTYINEYMNYFSLECENYGATYFDNLTITVVPEPATLLLLGFGVVMLRRKK